MEHGPEGAHEGPPEGRETEDAVLAVWREVLETDAVGATDGFFDVGGNSAALVRVQARLRETMGRDVPMTVLFQHPTPRALAAWLDAAGAEDEGESRADAGRRHAEERRGMRARRRDARRERE